MLLRWTLPDGLTEIGWLSCPGTTREHVANRAATNPGNLDCFANASAYGLPAIGAGLLDNVAGLAINLDVLLRGPEHVSARVEDTRSIGPVDFENSHEVMVEGGQESNGPALHEAGFADDGTRA